MLETELELKRALSYVHPLMAILNKKSDETGRQGGGGGCCNYGPDYLGILSLIALGLLFFFLITLISTTASSGRRKKRANSSSSNNNEITNEIS